MDDQNVQNYGYVPGADGYAGCRMTLAQNRSQATMAAGAALLQASRPRPVVTCHGTSTTMGGAGMATTTGTATCS